MRTDRQSIQDLKSGQITPKSVVGGGYINARKVAMEWLALQVINSETQNDFSGVFGASSGNAFKTQNKAENSKVFKSLESNQFKTINNLPVASFGICEGVEDKGYMIWVKLGKEINTKAA
jgi:hypothetical protein